MKIYCGLVALVLLSGASGDIYAQCASCTFSNSGDGTSYNLNSGQTLCITGGTFTGSINNLPAGATICIAAGATFQPGGFNNISGTLNNYGTVKFGTVSVNAGFVFNNSGTFTLDNINQNGAMTINNQSAGIMNIGQSFYLANGSTLSNSGIMYYNSDFSTNSGTNFTNNTGGRFYTQGNFNPSGNVNNYGYGRAKSFINMNSGGNFNNYCSYVSDAGFNNNSNTTRNYGYMLITGTAGDLFQNNAAFYNDAAGFVQGIRLLNNNSVTGSGNFRFTGQTTNQGPFGNDGGKINFYDTGLPSHIMDVENTVPHSSVTKIPRAAIDTNTLRASCNYAVFLPVKLTSFDVRSAAGNTVFIQWTVAEEKDLAFYFLQGSIDGVTYKQLAAVQPTAGNPAGAYQYTYRANEGIRYFRLQMVDKDGKSDYSPVKTISTQAVAAGLSILGNPAHTKTTLLVSAASVPFVKLSLHDITGRVLMMLDRVPTNTLFTLNDLSRYKAGIYILRAVATGFSAAGELIIR